METEASDFEIPERADGFEFGLPLVQPGDFSIEERVPESQPLPTEDILINIILDQDEGAAVNQGRYTTWTCIYLIHKEWLELADNRQKLANRFPVFAVADFRKMPFTRIALKSETYAKLTELWPDYYQLIPVTNLFEKEFKTVGVKINKRELRKVLYLYELPAITHTNGQVLFLCIFGEWFQGSAMQRRTITGEKAAVKYSEKWSTAAACIQEYIDLLGPGTLPTEQEQEVPIETA